MTVGIRQVLILVIVCVTKFSLGSQVKEYSVSNFSMHPQLIDGSTFTFTCEVNKSETAVLKVANHTVAEAKRVARREVAIDWKVHGKKATCIAKDASGKVVSEKSSLLDVWFPPIRANHYTKHHYKFMTGHKDHVTIHFLTNPGITKQNAHVNLKGPKGNRLHHFEVIHVSHYRKSADHFFILPFREVRESDFGNYSVTITSTHFPDKPLHVDFVISELAGNDDGASGVGGLVAAIVVGVLLTIGLVSLMIFMITRHHKHQPLPEARRPIVTEEVGPSNEDGLIDDVFVESRPGRSHIGSIDDSVM